MKLDAWLRQDHPLADRLRLVERLSQALNGVHDRGEALAALEPARVEVGSDFRCDLSGAERGSPVPAYAAPERIAGGPPSPEADVYSAGAIAWEVLVGRPCGELPAALSDVAPDLPHELASAVTGCLERSPQWRPKDLTYLAQLAAAQQRAMRGGTEPEPELTSPPPRLAGAPRTPARRSSRSHLPLLVAALLVASAAAASYWWIRGQAPDEPPDSPAARAPGRVTPSPAPTPISTPSPSPYAGASPEVRLTATAVVPTPAGGPAAALEPVVLTALSPLAIRRPGRALLDLRGTGLRPDLRARVLPLREVPRGITVARQKWVSASLVTVLLDLDQVVTPGVYAITLEDPAGGQAKPLQFTVTK
jgi:hypothetical protein